MNANPHTGSIEQAVQKEAYLLYLASGCIPGRDLENWLTAHQRLTGGAPEATKQIHESLTRSLNFPPNAKVQRRPSETINPFAQHN